MPYYAVFGTFAIKMLHFHAHLFIQPCHTGWLSAFGTNFLDNYFHSLGIPWKHTEMDKYPIVCLEFELYDVSRILYCKLSQLTVRNCLTPTYCARLLLAKVNNKNLHIHGTWRVYTWQNHSDHHKNFYSILHAPICISRQYLFLFQTTRLITADYIPSESELYLDSSIEQFQETFS